jgi:hypothetical protein
MPVSASMAGGIGMPGIDERAPLRHAKRRRIRRIGLDPDDADLGDGVDRPPSFPWFPGRRSEHRGEQAHDES